MVITLIILCSIILALVGYFTYNVCEFTLFPTKGWKILSDGERFHVIRKGFLVETQWIVNEEGSLWSDPASAHDFKSYEAAQAMIAQVFDNIHERRKAKKKLKVCDGKNHVRRLNCPGDYAKLNRQELIELVLAIRREIPFGYYGGHDDRLPERVQGLVKEIVELEKDLEQYEP